MLNLVKKFFRRKRNYHFDRNGFKVNDESTGHILDVKLSDDMFSGVVVIPEKDLKLPLASWPAGVNLFQDDHCFKGSGRSPAGDWSFHIVPTDPFSVIMEKVISLANMASKEADSIKFEAGEGWVEVLLEWADELGLDELRWEENPRNRDGGFWVGFPRDRNELIKLKGLNFNGVGATEIPKEVGYLKNLKKVWCCDNEISELPVELFSILGLEEIRASGNKIKKIPHEVGFLEKLIILDLEGNNLEYVSENITKLRNLERLDVRDQPHNLGYVGTPLSDSQVSALSAMGDVVRW
ncbi:MULTISPECIES: leucine-rich repeat domain-containing protein [unclassified Halomonas]|uniref:leucine-rich repeat domain-containing protein n=1 Tax=unclassified Halomonas TaxID=2609666 RepID=UPI0009908F75|nr:MULTISPECIES: leucine-rich repeat domain-containing protein [unclassified Halomonas]AQU82248.1 hypothetical protein B2G49_06345 [Halomonas sp. 'Soap Lake \